MSLSRKAMLVTVTVSCWTATKTDKKVSNEVEAQHQASNAGRYNKMLIAKSALDPLTSQAASIRQLHYKLTLPWIDNGGRLLPAKLYMDYQQQMGAAKNKYAAMADDFVRDYDVLVNDSRKRLGTMFNERDYPTAKQLRQKFGVDTDILPVPEGSDFRVEVAQSERNLIMADIEAKLHKRQALAMADAWGRVKTVVSTIRDRCADDKPIFRQSLMENAESLVKLLPGLNISEDPVLAQAAELISKNLLVSLVALKNSKQLRLQLVARAQQILSMVPNENPSN